MERGAFCGQRGRTQRQCGDDDRGGPSGRGRFAGSHTSLIAGLLRGDLRRGPLRTSGAPYHHRGLRGRRLMRRQFDPPPLGTPRPPCGAGGRGGVFPAPALCQPALFPVHGSRRSRCGRIGWLPVRRGAVRPTLWEKKEEKYETGAGVFNGELGTILNILDEEKQVKIKFDDGKIAWYEYSELDQIEHAYAITIHKSQGSEFDVVIMPIMQAAPMLLTRNLLYTGMTRAKKMLIIVGNPDVIRFMIQNVNTKKRNTGLEEKIRKVMEGD